MKRLKEKFRAFLKDRNGLDDLGLLSMSLSVLMLFLGVLLQSLWFMAAAILLFLYAVYRELSRKVEERKYENLRFLGMREHLRFRRQSRKVRRQAGKAYKYLKCRHCRKLMRIPREKGKAEVICPHCGKRFWTKS